MINPEIIESDGEQTGDEGCLSVPGKAGQVTRPNYVKARFMGEDMNEYEIEGEELLPDVSATSLTISTDISMWRRLRAHFTM